MRALWVVLLLVLIAPAAAAPTVRPPRAYEGAPPAIPHDLSETGTECMACHETGMPGTGAIAVPHAKPGRCLQCHVSGGASKVAVFRENRFVGYTVLGRLRGGSRTPPRIPHPTFLRENCLACHGPDGYTALATPHPERARCTQCHQEKR